MSLVSEAAGSEANKTAQTKSLVRSRLSSYDRLSSTGCGRTGNKSIGKTVSSS
jgi:hypothetical protein